MTDKKYDVLCDLEHASTEISGIPFVETEAGMLASALSLEQSLLFKGIKGYTISDHNKAETAAERKLREQEEEAETKRKEQAAADKLKQAGGGGADSKPGNTAGGTTT